MVQSFYKKFPIITNFLEFIILLSIVIPSVYSIGCYKCSTTNNDSFCEDPFNPGLTPNNLYEPDCKSGIQDRVGLFPARYCLKVSGYIGKTNQQIVVRTCAVSKLLDSDSSYSSFTIQLENNTQIQVTSGLIASCKDDGCNSSVSLFSNKNLFYKSVLILVCVFLNNIRSHFY